MHIWASDSLSAKCIFVRLHPSVAVAKNLHCIVVCLIKTCLMREQGAAGNYSLVVFLRKYCIGTDATYVLFFFEFLVLTLHAQPKNVK